MKRRTFIAAIGGAAASSVSWPLAARAQERVRRIGMLNPAAVADPESTARLTAFAQGLQQLGWTIGGNVRIEYRWGEADPERTRKGAVELVALKPDVIVTTGAAGMGAVLQATRTIPTVFAIVPDPVSAGFVESLARPGGNATGFLMFEFDIAGKWLELLKQVAPQVTRAAVLRDPAITAGIGQFSVIQSVASSLGIAVSPINLRDDAGDVERAITAFARLPNGGLLMTASALSGMHRALVSTLAIRHKLPLVAHSRHYAAGGALISYGPDFVDQFRRAAGYVDRILKGEKPADLPVQAPTKYELAINLKTAKALGLTVPPSVLARADEVIE